MAKESSMQRQASMADVAIAKSALASDWGAARRKIVDQAMLGVVIFCAAIGVAILAMILINVAWQGFPAINLSFFTDRPLPVGEAGGGVAPAIIGTLVMMLVVGGLGVR